MWQLYVGSCTRLQYCGKFQFFALLPTDIDSLKHAIIDHILHQLIGFCFTLFIFAFNLCSLLAGLILQLLATDGAVAAYFVCILQRVLLTELFFGTKE